MNRDSIQLLQRPGLPADIRLAVYELPPPVDDKNRSQLRQIEKKTGRELIKCIAERELELSGVHVKYEESGKPVAICGQTLLHLSIAHSRRLVCGAISQTRSLGVDIEQEDRNVISRLADRIRHPQENEDLYNLPIMQIWTLKEAALKWSGSGLRVAMRKVVVQEIGQSRFRAVLDDGKKVEICSFKEHRHWIAVAY